MFPLVSTVATQVLSSPHGDAVSLNPQPLPPEGLAGVLQHAHGEAVALNPQPLPPVDGGGHARANPGNAVSINPQPLPPRWGIAIHASLLDAVALNPQPLPPRVGTPLIDDCGTPHGRVPLPHPGPRGDIGQG